MSLRTLPLLISALTLALLVTSVTTSAYIMKIDAPDHLYAGEKLDIYITTTLPTGTTFPLRIYDPTYTGKILYEKFITVQDNAVSVNDNGVVSERPFVVSFETRNMSQATYKIEASEIGSYKYLGDSKYILLIKIIDRQQYFKLTSPLVQGTNYTHNDFEFSGRMQMASKSGIKFEIYLKDSVFPIHTSEPIKCDSYGNFKYIEKNIGFGEREVVVSDDTGFITSFNINIVYDLPTVYFTEHGQTMEPPTLEPTPIYTPIRVTYNPVVSKLPTPLPTISELKSNSKSIFEIFPWLSAMFIIFGVVVALLLAFFIYRIVRPKKDELEDEWVGGQLYGDDFYEKK